jgi:PKD repeat protein
MAFRFLLLIIFCLSFDSTIAQQDHFCGQHIVTDAIFTNHKGAEEDYNRIVQSLRGKKTTQYRTDSTLTIPVVFQVLHNNGIENISEAQLLDQIKILNRDYNKQNADTSKIVNSFKNNIANLKFNFELATIDPDGNCTNGIIRHVTDKTVWDANNFSNYIFSWPSNKYLNIYVVRSINIAPAYTILPDVPTQPEWDVIVAQHDLVGSIGTSNVSNSRAITHEVGHWFGLPHIWGVTNQPGVACGNDNVDDTPITKGFITCSTNNSKICDPTIEENVQNYMDYAPCKIMFTNGQASYMRETIQLGLKGRNNLVSEANLMATGVIGNVPCKTKANFIADGYSICVGDSINFLNLSQTGSVSETYQWRSPGGIPEFSNDKNPVVVYPNIGVFEVELIASGQYGSDTSIQYITVLSPSADSDINRSYTFEDGTLPNDLSVVNLQNDDVVWEVNPNVGADNTNSCIYLPSSRSIETKNNMDYFETTGYDFTNSNTPQMTFFYAYAKKYEDQNDVFKIEFTEDCGKTWKPVFGIPNINLMALQTGGTLPQGEFIPSKPEHWKKITLKSSFTSQFKNKRNVRFRFYFKSDAALSGSNNIYLDEINVFDPTFTSTQDLSSGIVNVYPNPTSGPLTIVLTDYPMHKTSASITSIDGTNTQALIPVSQTTETIEYRVQESSLPNGVYFLTIKSEGHIDEVRKVVVVK